MNDNQTKVKIGILILIPLIASMLFLGINGLINADQNNPELNQTSQPTLSPLGYAQLEAVGTSLDGDTSIAEIAGMDVSSDHIEFFTIRHEMKIPTDQRTGSQRASGRVVHSPVIITKTIDQTSPLLIQALHQNQIVEGDFKLFDTGDSGETRHRYTINIMSGHVTSVRTVTIVDGGTTFVVEEVSFAYQTIRFTDEVNAVEYEYSWSGGV